MAFLLILDSTGEGRERQRIRRRLSRMAQNLRYSVWEFKRLPDLIQTAELVYKNGGRALAFSRKDEILLCISQTKKLLNRAAR
jgi:hypothetical protein